MTYSVTPQEGSPYFRVDKINTVPTTNGGTADIVVGSRFESMITISDAIEAKESLIASHASELEDLRDIKTQIVALTPPAPTPENEEEGEEEND